MCHTANSKDHGHTRVTLLNCDHGYMADSQIGSTTCLVCCKKNTRDPGVLSSTNLKQGAGAITFAILEDIC